MSDTARHDRKSTDVPGARSPRRVACGSGGRAHDGRAAAAAGLHPELPLHAAGGALAAARGRGGGGAGGLVPAPGADALAGGGGGGLRGAAALQSRAPCPAVRLAAVCRALAGAADGVAPARAARLAAGRGAPGVGLPSRAVPTRLVRGPPASAEPLPGGQPAFCRVAHRRAGVAASARRPAA